MKVLSAITKFPNYIFDFYGRHPQLKTQPYEVQYKALVDDSYGSFETWSEGLSKFGYQTERIYVTIPEIQKQWAKEQGLLPDRSNWIEDIAKAQIKKYEPEIIIVSKQTTFPQGFVQNLKSEFPSIRLIIAWCCSPHANTKVFNEYDFILSCSPEMVEDFRIKGYCCYYLKHAFDPRVLKKISINTRAPINFSFIGSILLTPGYHVGRETLLAELVKATNLEIWSSISRLTPKQQLKTSVTRLVNNLLLISKRSNLLSNLISQIPYLKNLYAKEGYLFLPRNIHRNIIRRAHPPVYGLEMYQKLSDSRVTLNMHGDIALTSAANIRLFESTGVGTCLLTDWKENLKDLFEPDIEVAVYRDTWECIERAQYLLKNEEDRLIMAKAGQKRTLAVHTIYHRAEQLDTIIKEHLRNK